MICRRCSQPLEQGDRYCRKCGEDSLKKPFYYTHLGIWVMFLMIGPLNLYFIFASPVISKKAKVLHAAFSVLISAALIYFIVVLVLYILNLYNTYLNMTV